VVFPVVATAVEREETAVTQREGTRERSEIRGEKVRGGKGGGRGGGGGVVVPVVATAVGGKDTVETVEV
jgi:hypothetical protein